MPSAKGARAGGFSAFERLQRPAGEAPPGAGAVSSGSPGGTSAASRSVARPPPPPREVSLEEVRTLLEDLRTTVVALSFQKALEHVRSRDWGALKKRAGVAKLLGIAWKAPLKASGFAIDGHSFPCVLTAVRAHSGQPGVRLLSEEVEKLLKFFPGALFGSQAGNMKGILPSPSGSGRGGAFSKLAPGGGRQEGGSVPTPMRPATLRGRPMGLGEAKDLLRRLKDDSSTKEFQRGLLDIIHSGQPNGEKAAAAFVCRAWSSAMSTFDFPVTPAGFREMADGILRCAYNRHVEMLAHEVEALLHVPTGSLFGVAPEEGAGEEEPEPLAPRNARPGDIHVLLVHNAERTELRVSVHRDATFGDLKEAAARKLGRNTILTMGRLVRKSGTGTFVSYKDTDLVNHVREVLVLGADLKMDGGGDGQPHMPPRQGSFRLNLDDMTLVTQPVQGPQLRGGAVLDQSTAQHLLVELHKGYAERDFQQRLKQLYSSLGATAQFARERQRLALEVQTVVLPKYGFRGNMDGVVDMQRALAGFVSGNDEMRSVAEDCDNLLLAKVVTSKKKVKTETMNTATEYSVNKEKVQPEPEESPVLPAADPEPEPPSRQEPRVEVKPPPKPVAPAKEVYFVVRHAINVSDEEVWMKMMSTATFAEVKSQLANKLGREEVRLKGRLVYRAESGAGVWTDFLDEEELGRDRRVVHLMGVALPSKEIRLLVRHAIKEDSREVLLNVWTHWKFREVKQALAGALGRNEVYKQAKFVFRPHGQNAQGAWAAFKDEEQVGERSELNVLGLDDLTPTPEAQEAIEEAERQARAKAEKAKAQEEAEQKAKEETKVREKAESFARTRAEAERKVKEAAERRLREEAEEAKRRAREEAEEKEKEEAARRAKEKKAERKAKKEALLSMQGERERRTARESGKTGQGAQREPVIREGVEPQEMERAGESAQRLWEETTRKQKEKAEQQQREEAERTQPEGEQKASEDESERRRCEEEEAELRRREQEATDHMRREQQEAERAQARQRQREQEEAERRRREQQDAEQAEAEQRRKEQEEAERRRREQEEADRRQREQEEAKQRRAEQEEAQRRRRDQDEAERRRREQEEAERRRREQEDAERRRREQEEAERRRREQEEAERRRREQEEAERRRREQEEAERRRREQEEAERSRREQQEAERRQREEAEHVKREEAERTEREAREKEEERKEVERKAEEAKVNRARVEKERRAREEVEADRKARAKAKQQPEQTANEEEAKRKAKEETQRRLKEGSQHSMKIKQAAAAMLEPALPDQQPGEGRMWIVVGGEDKGGILVRMGESFESKPLPFRLVTGARVEELEVVGNRFHYKRIRGDGPDYGWVNIKLNDKVLLIEEKLG